ncbi:MAG: recombination regulator RecX [Neisseria sp.]|nr:recombination regulator RecX [Neisseria sp.]
MKPKSLRSRALAIVSRQEISQAELRRKLAPHAENPAELEQILREFAENQWQSDERYTEVYIHSKAKQHGSLRLKQALANKGIDSDLVQQYLPEREQEHAAALAVLQKKFKQPAQTPQEKQKQIRFLAYRGFKMDSIQHALKNAWQDESFDSDFGEHEYEFE